MWMSKRINAIILILILLFLLTSCNQTTSDLHNEDGAKSVESAMEVEALLNNLIVAFESKDGIAFSELVHPKKGIRFSNYGCVELESDVVLNQEQIKNSQGDKDVYDWGDYYNMGESQYEATISEYLNQNIYYVDYSLAIKTDLEKSKSQAGAHENYFETYEDAIIIEFYFKNNFPEELDWRSVSVVISEDEVSLIGIINNEWTP